MLMRSCQINKHKTVKNKRLGTFKEKNNTFQVKIFYEH